MNTKKYLWVISLAFGLYSCEKSDTIIGTGDEHETEQFVIEDKDPAEAYYREYIGSINEECNALGYGYDVTGEYLSSQSIRKQVLNIAGYKEIKPERIIKGTTSYGHATYYYGSTFSDYLKDIMSSSKVTDSFSHEDETSTLNTYLYFIGNFANHQYLQSKYSHSDQYSFASMEILQHSKHIHINDQVSSMLEFLSKDFLEDLDKYPADKVVEKYGTHVLMDISLGGRYKLIYRSAIEEEEYFTNKEYIVKHEFNTLLSKIGFLAPSSNIQTDEEFNLNKSNKDLYVQLYLEDGIMSFKYDLEDGIPTYKDIQKWGDETLGVETQLTRINWKESYPLYEFISDPVKKNDIKSAVESYIRMSRDKL